jgi:uncharacterized protein (TIGR03067 family)
VGYVSNVPHAFPDLCNVLPNSGTRKARCFPPAPLVETLAAIAGEGRLPIPEYRPAVLVSGPDYASNLHTSENLMRRAMWIAACALAVGIAPLGADDKDSKFDAAKLVGDWTYVSGMKGGEKVDPANLKNKVVITKESLTLTGDQKFVMKYELDSKKSPVVINMEMTESPFGAGAKAIGIISCDGKELKLCYDPEGKKTPEKFEST